MTTKISRILNEAIGIASPNILTTVTHAGYEYNLAKSNASFFSISNCSGEKKDWDHHNRKQPDNYFIFDFVNQLPAWVDFDILLSQHRWGSFQLMDKISNKFSIPHINLEHTLPIPEWPKEKTLELSSLSADVNVFISEYSRNAWGKNQNNSIVIKHGVDTELFNPGNRVRYPRILSVVNRWIERDYCCGYNIWKRVTDKLPVFPVGDTPGLSLPAKNTNELVEMYQSSAVFINTSTVSPVPSSLLEAMSCGCAVVSTATCMIPEIIIDGYNGFISNDENELREKTIFLLKNPSVAQNLGKNARDTILSQFSLERFVKDWNSLFERLV